MPQFRLGRNLIENIDALRRALGSATRELSRADLAQLLTKRHPEGRKISESAIRWWGQAKGEPDVHTIKVMADLAGVSFEQFALGAQANHVATGLSPAVGVKLTDEEIARMRTEAERQDREQAKRSTVAGNHGTRGKKRP